MMKTIFQNNSRADGVRLGDVKLECPIPNDLLRDGPIGLPQLSELEVMRHYKSLSDRNFCIEKGFYPLGSCTMKYNPKINEVVSSYENFTNLHPNQDDEDCQGALELMYNLQEQLKILTGMDAGDNHITVFIISQMSGFLFDKFNMISKTDIFCV